MDAFLEGHPKAIRVVVAVVVIVATHGLLMAAMVLIHNNDGVQHRLSRRRAEK